MKRLVIFLLIAVLLAGSIFAQDRSNRQRENRTVTVEGTLQLERGFVAVASGDSVYLVPMLNRYIGFINGLTEGAPVSVEGYEFRNFIQPTAITINGRTHDFRVNDSNNGPGPSLGRGNSNPPRRDNPGPNRGNFGPISRNGPNRQGRRSCCN